MTHGLTDEKVAKLVTYLMQTLGLSYDVIKENNNPKGDHIHIEYDPKRPDISAVIIFIFILSATNLLPAAYGNFILSITTPQLI